MCLLAVRALVAADERRDSAFSHRRDSVLSQAEVGDGAIWHKQTPEASDHGMEASDHGMEGIILRCATILSFRG